MTRRPPRYRAAALEALHAADPDATLLEINTGGVARGYRAAPYPALFLLREWRSMGGRSSSSDAHSKDCPCFTDTGRRPRSPGRRVTQSALLTDGACPAPLSGVRFFKKMRAAPRLLTACLFGRGKKAGKI